MYVWMQNVSTYPGSLYICLHNLLVQGLHLARNDKLWPFQVYLEPAQLGHIYSWTHMYGLVDWPSTCFVA
jgi:hypothetical protein